MRKAKRFLILTSLLSMVGCSGCEDTPGVPALSKGQRCQPGAGTCESIDGRPAECDAGFCVPTDCTRGTEGCACHEDGNCEVIGSEPGTCSGNICVATVGIPDGTLGGACTDAAPCLDGLDCVANVCAQPGCPTGALGCPCGPYGACADLGGDAARCFEGACVVGNCAAGALGCECDDGSCGGGQCIEGWCRPPSTVLVTVADPSARACDILLTESGDLPFSDDVVFSSAVRGEQITRSPKVSMSFIQRNDSAFAGPVARVEPRSGISGSLTLTYAACFDRAGQPLTNPGVELR